jgi:alpha-glucosidase
LETIYFDIPYMKDYADFSVDTDKFPNLAQFSTDLKTKNQKLVVIVDAAISADDTSNKYYKMGND